jgi:4'-phosphopantetheinyl transferase
MISPAGQFELTDQAIHVHAVRLAAPDEVAAHFQALLASDERIRAARFRFSHLQRSFSLARGALRILLGRYLRADARAIPLQYGPKGKPSLASPARLRFNLSHSDGMALFAFTLDCEVGVDIEAIRPVPDLEQIAIQQFSAEQAAEILALPAGGREAAFFRCWTRKEAFGKALGVGLFIDGSSEERCTLLDLPAPPAYAAALAYLETTRALRVWPPVDAAGLCGADCSIR